MRWPTLFSPVTFAGLELKNRLMVGPMTRISATADGRATTDMARYYAEFVKGGFGLVTTEAIYIDEAHSQGWPNQPGIANAAQCEAWHVVVDAVHQAGAPIIAQLYHTGALRQFNRFRATPIGPSSIRPHGEQTDWFRGSGPYDVPLEMTLADIAEVIETFGRAAESAIRAGFDGVEVHGSNGYLVDQFLSDCSNQRHDDYGGSLRGRLRFPLEVLSAVRAAVPERCPVGISISVGKANHPDYTWPGGAEDARQIFRALGEMGDIFIRVHGSIKTNARMPDPVFGSDQTLPGLARRCSGRPVSATGDLDNPDTADAMLRRGDLDLVGLSRAALADPHWPAKVLAGEDPIRFDPQALVPDATIASATNWRERASAAIGHAPHR